MRWQRRARTALTVLAITTILTTQAALAADPTRARPTQRASAIFSPPPT